MWFAVGTNIVGCVVAPADERTESMLISANGISLHVEQSGKGDLALVFLHYWGGTARTWRAVIDVLPKDLRMIALDARGWGTSDQPEDGYDISTMADDVAAAIATLGLKAYVLIGHSMGGKVAQLLASRRPPGLVGLVLVAPSPAQGKSLPAEAREMMAGAYTSAAAAGWTVDNILAGSVLAADIRDQVIDDILQGAAAAKCAWPATAIAEDVSANLADINVPVLIVGGENDKVDSVEMLRAVVLPSLPGAVLMTIPIVGHLLPLEAPGELAEQIVGFIDCIDKPEPEGTHTAKAGI